MKYLFYCLITLARNLHLSGFERHAHDWREPKAKRLLEKKKKICFGFDLPWCGLGVAPEVMVVAHSRVHLSSGDRVVLGLGNQGLYGVWCNGDTGQHR